MRVAASKVDMRRVQVALVVVVLLAADCVAAVWVARVAVVVCVLPNWAAAVRVAAVRVAVAVYVLSNAMHEHAV